jgi:glutathione synthase/RimK-type ligase-like ATP-grasp enzyme
MKLVLANNQTDRFTEFYQELMRQEPGLFDYAAYDELLFIFDSDASQAIAVEHVGLNKNLQAYDGVYLNGYLDTYELAATTATCCQTLTIPFVNRELADAPSLSKLSAYAKLARAGVRLPRTLAGAKRALLLAGTRDLQFPLVLKRADADRGIDNYKVSTEEEMQELLGPHDDRSIWILQEFVPNDGFYLVSFYDQQPEFSIFRSLEERPDQNEQKSHMYKPKGGTNATLIAIAELPLVVVDTAQDALNAMNRQIGSVDLLYDPQQEKAYVLEVNYNPQLVTISTFKEVRIRAFLDGIKKIH